MKTRQKIGMGWLPDSPDQRDFVYTTPSAIFKALPAKADLRKNCPPVYDQKCLGSCTANAIAAAIEFEQIKQKKKSAFMPSRQFIYYNERVMENTVSSDAGAQIRDGIKSVAKLGVCAEKDWPYTLGTCNQTGNDENGEPIYDVGLHFKVRPSASCYANALKYEVMQYHSVPRSIQQIKGCLAEGYPIAFGMVVYESFYDIKKDGMMPLPAHKEQKDGGHAVLAVGYDDVKQAVIVRNSWGAGWADKGYFYMPYSFITSVNCDDFWTIRSVEI